MKPKEGCGGCSRLNDNAIFKYGCETLLDELRGIGVDCWRLEGTILIWDEMEKE